MAQSRIIRPGEVQRQAPLGVLGRVQLKVGKPTVSIVGGGVPGPKALRFGPYSGMSNLTGIGPGGDTGAPYYRIAGTNPHTEGQTNRRASLALARQLGITIFSTVCNSTDKFGSTTNTFSLNDYITQLNKIAADDVYSDGINTGDIVLVFADEPYHPKWGNTWPPSLLNRCARECKLRWPTGYTFVRGDCNKMQSGWANEGPPAGGYDAIDFCCMQYEGPQAQSHQTFGQQLTLGQQQAGSVGLFVVPSLNLWAGGNHVTTLGVNPCFDNQGIGVGNGVICGAVQAQGSGLSPGDLLTCAEWNAVPNANKRTLQCSPAWIEAVINEVYNRPEIPWLIAWTYASSNSANYGLPLQNRADWQAKMDAGILKCLSRTQADVLPAPKAYP